MLKNTKLIINGKDGFVKSDNSDLKDERNSIPKENGSPILGVRMQYPRDMPNGYKLLHNPNCFFKRRFLSGVSSCKNISFVKANGSFNLTDESIEDLRKMLIFKSEPCYQRPYRLIADSKLCIKGNCDTVSMLLRPGW